jgi:hypothetical protein
VVIPFQQGQGVGFTIGGLEMVGCVCLVAATWDWRVWFGLVFERKSYSGFI